jgi:hypothetical protein
MTLSEYLVRRVRWILIPGGAIVLVTVAFAANATKGSVWHLLEAAAFPLFIAVYALYSLNIRCPRCHVRLGYIDLGGGKRQRVPLPGMDCCSNCGLHRNENIPTA